MTSNYEQKFDWRIASYKSILFLDIETGSQTENFAELDESMQELWNLKRKTLTKNKPELESMSDEEFYFENAGLYAEFGRVICISIGALTPDGKKLHIKTYCNIDEQIALEDLSKFLFEKAAERPTLCGHNIKEFDVPYLARRMLINGIKLPPQLDLAGKKPWESKHIDTLELWKFGDYKSFTSLKLLMNIFGLPSPKGDIDGSQVNEVLWKENNLKRIVTYCEKDVVAVVQLFLKFKNGAPIGEDAVTIHDWSEDD